MEDSPSERNGPEGGSASLVGQGVKSVRVHLHLLLVIGLTELSSPARDPTLCLVGMPTLLRAPEWCLWLICCETDHFDHADSVPRDRLSYHPGGPGVWRMELWHSLPPWWQVHRACAASPACELCLLATPCFERNGASLEDWRSVSPEEDCASFVRFEVEE